MNFSIEPENNHTAIVLNKSKIPKGYKICESCKEQVAAVSTKCKFCDFIFIPKLKPLPKEKPNAPARGWRQCEHCGEYTAARKISCNECGHEKTPQSNSLGKMTKNKQSSDYLIKNPIDRLAFIRVLVEKGFKFERLINEFAPNAEAIEKIDPKFAHFNFNYQEIPANADNSDVFISQTSPQVQISMTLDKFLEISGIRA